MKNYILRIKSKIPNSEKEAVINLDSLNLIITGANGCGKTQFINHLYDYLTQRIVNRQNIDINQTQSQITMYENALKSTTRADSNYQSYVSTIQTLKNQIKLTSEPPLTVNNIEQFTIDYHDNLAILIKFDATRQANIRAANSSRSAETLKQESIQLADTGSLFEEYLVSQKTAQAYAESPNIDNMPIEAKKISDWFTKLQVDLQELFEDPSLTLIFESSSQSFFIKQDNKSKYRFQQLSSGFSSILAIYANLLTKIQLRATTPEDLYGIVFIDEIDAHLHVSLQRKILSFLVKAFPKVQFIVSTHSPFVVSSVSNAVIYDLSTLEQVEDLSMYSYEAILSGLFNVLPVSEVLKEKIIALGKMLSSPLNHLDKIESLVLEIGEHENVLDSESATFLKRAKIQINKLHNKEV